MSQTIQASPFEVATSEFHELQNEMLGIIDRVDEYSWNKGLNGGLDWGFEQFNEAFEGLQPGLILIGAGPNVGKSALCLQLGWQIALANKDFDASHVQRAYVLYFSLDDNDTEILPRVVALDQGIPIGVVKSPAKFEQMGYVGDLVRRKEGIARLKANADVFKLIDGNYRMPSGEVFGNSVEKIEQVVEYHVRGLNQSGIPYKLVVFIDNFHDISVEKRLQTSDTNEKWQYIAERISGLCTVYDIPVICTSEMRKLNGARRPVADDIRESVKLSYEAKAILTCYNEVGIRGDAATISWDCDGEKKPILEVMVAKNKYGTYKKRMFFNFDPGMSRLDPVSDVDAATYADLVNS
jgi:replicative DNA helicase